MINLKCFVPYQNINGLYWTRVKEPFPELIKLAEEYPGTDIDIPSMLQKWDCVWSCKDYIYYLIKIKDNKACFYAWCRRYENIPFYTPLRDLELE